MWCETSWIPSPPPALQLEISMILTLTTWKKRCFSPAQRKKWVQISGKPEKDFHKREADISLRCFWNRLQVWFAPGSCILFLAEDSGKKKQFNSPSNVFIPGPLPMAGGSSRSSVFFWLLVGPAYASPSEGLLMWALTTDSGASSGGAWGTQSWCCLPSGFHGHLSHLHAPCNSLFTEIMKHLFLRGNKDWAFKKKIESNCWLIKSYILNCIILLGNF